MSSIIPDVRVLENLLEQLRKESPEHGLVLDAFAPLLLQRENLLHEHALKRKPKAAAEYPLLPRREAPLCAKVSAQAALALLDAIVAGLPANSDAAKSIMAQLHKAPGAVRRLCKAFLSGDSTALETYAAKHQLSAELLKFLIVQTSQFMLARSVNALPEILEKHTSNLCPYCGSRPDLSIIHGSGGERRLLCSQCGRHWRYTRTACVFCGVDTPENLRQYYVEGNKEDRAVLCATCNHYILETDIRKRDIAIQASRPLGMVLGHLDALVQEEDAIPVSVEPEDAFFSPPAIARVQ